jgi:hypothetical protein
VFLGHLIRRQRKRGTRKHYVYTKPSKKAIASIKDKVKAKTYRSTRHMDLDKMITRLNRSLAGSPGVPSLSHDVAPEAPRRASATDLQACGARCRCWSDARRLGTGRLVQHLWRDYPGVDQSLTW